MSTPAASLVPGVCRPHSDCPERLKELKKQLASASAKLKEAEAEFGTRAPTKKACEGEREGVKDSQILNSTPSPHAAASHRSLQPRAPVENGPASARIAFAAEWMQLKEDWEKIEKVADRVLMHDCTHALTCMRMHTHMLDVLH